MINILSSHLQQCRPGQKSPILRAAPTGVASNQINGQTLHSLLRLPIDGNYRPLTESPTVLQNLQRVFAGVRYLVIDEKSMLGLKTLGWIDRRLHEIFSRAERPLRRRTKHNSNRRLLSTSACTEQADIRRLRPIYEGDGDRRVQRVSRLPPFCLPGNDPASAGCGPGGVPQRFS